MHTLYFVKVKKQKNMDSETAQNIAQSVLDNNGFAGECGYFSSSRADWYAIGGRWSGMFTDWTSTKLRIIPLLEEEISKSPDLLNYLYINPHLIDADKRAKIDAIAVEETGQKFFRANGFHGLVDDAVIITPEIIRKLEDERYSDTEMLLLDEDEEIIDEARVKYLDSKDLGDWLVIIDYHN